MFNTPPITSTRSEPGPGSRACASRTITLHLLVLVLVFNCAALAQQPAKGDATRIEKSPIEFMYGGLLKDENGPVNGVYDFTFDLYTEETGGERLGSFVRLDKISKNDVPVIDGRFAVVLDFGPAFINGWMEVTLRPGHSKGPHAVLSPRPLVTLPMRKVTNRGLGLSGTRLVGRVQLGRGSRSEARTPIMPPIRGEKLLRALDDIETASFVLATVTAARADRGSDGRVNVVIETIENSGPTRWYGTPVVVGDTLVVYARVVAPGMYRTANIPTGRIDVTVDKAAEEINHVVVFGSNARYDIVPGKSAEVTKFSSNAYKPLGSIHDLIRLNRAASGATTTMKGAIAPEVRLADVVSATAARTSDGGIEVLITTSSAHGPWNWFGDHVVKGDTLIVYARAISRRTSYILEAGILTSPSESGTGEERPSSTSVDDSGQIRMRLESGLTEVRRVVIHGAGREIEISLAEPSENR